MFFSFKAGVFGVFFCTFLFLFLVFIVKVVVDSGVRGFFLVSVASFSPAVVRTIFTLLPNLFLRTPSSMPLIIPTPRGFLPEVLPVPLQGLPLLQRGFSLQLLRLCASIQPAVGRSAFCPAICWCVLPAAAITPTTSVESFFTSTFAAVSGI